MKNDGAQYVILTAPSYSGTADQGNSSPHRRASTAPDNAHRDPARGPIVSDQALCENWIAGTGLDDIEEEPAKQREWTRDNPLFRLDNVIITPHAACYSEEAIRTVRQFGASEAGRALTGQIPLSPVNDAALAVLREPRHRNGAAQPGDNPLLMSGGSHVPPRPLNS